jgi:ribosome-associated translation inhibitor RaiA
MEIQTDVRIPSMIRNHVVDTLERLQRKHEGAILDVRLRNDGPQVECLIKLMTRDDRIFSSATGWDIRQVVQEAASRAAFQANKAVMRRAAMY